MVLSNANDLLVMLQVMFLLGRLDIQKNNNFANKVNDLILIDKVNEVFDISKSNAIYPLRYQRNVTSIGNFFFYFGFGLLVL